MNYFNRLLKMLFQSIEMSTPIRDIAFLLNMLFYKIEHLLLPYTFLEESTESTH